MESPGRTQPDNLREACETAYRSRILGILVSHRVNLSIGGSKKDMCPHEGLDISIGAVK
jgi:hypothetical protein